MKKLLIISGFLLFLSGCSLWNKETKISYNELRNQFVQDNFAAPLFSHTIATGHSFRERLQLTLQGNNDITDITLFVRGQKDFSLSGAMGNYFYDVNFLDKNENLPIRGSGDVLYISKDGKEYLRTNTTKIDLGTGNAEGIMVQLIVDALSKKWLSIDKTGFIQTWMFTLPLKDYFSLPVGIHALFASNFLTPGLQEQDGSYIVNGSSSVRDRFIPSPALSGFAFDGTIGTKNGQHIFDLQRFVSGSWKGIGQIMAGKGNLVLQSGNTDYAVARENAAYGAIHIVITYNIAGQKQWTISATIRQKLMDDGDLLWAMKGTISLFTLVQNLDLTFEGNYTISPQQSFNLRAPTNALLISQFFGDEFGLGALLDQ